MKTEEEEEEIKRCAGVWLVKYNRDSSSEKLSLLATSHIHKSRIVPYPASAAVCWMMRRRGVGGGV